MQTENLVFHMNLDEYQTSAVEIACSRKSLALLGSAGSGKSYILQRILSRLRQERGGYPTVVACALSNLTASRLEGQTIHALLGAPPHWRFSKEELWNIVRSKPYKMEILRKVEVLFIDEICVLTAVVLDSIDHVFRKVASSDENESKPFGGRQVVVAGDPFQLQAISQAPHDDDEEENHYDDFSDKESGKRKRYKEDLPAYFSRAWFLTFGGFGSGFVVFLNENYRQAGDCNFFGILQRIRTGTSTAEDIKTINGTGRNQIDPPSSHTLLCLRKRSVSRKNYEIMSSMHGHMYCSEAEDTFFSCLPHTGRRRLEDAVPSLLHFKVGSAVLLTRSIGDLSPGDRVLIASVSTRPKERNSAPSSIGYVIDKVVLMSGLTQYHVDVFTFSIRRNDTTVIALRKQLPFIPAYAITVHKSQGMTLSTVAMDFGDVNTWKPAGMVYVVLSRCTSLSGVWARGLTADHIRVSQNAINLLHNLINLRTNYPNRILYQGSVTRDCVEQTNRVFSELKNNRKENDVV